MRFFISTILHIKTIGLKFSFEEIEWLKPCVESIDQTEIRFNGEIESLDDFQRSSIAQYLFCKRTIITRTEQSYGRVPFAGLCRLFISVYVPGAGLPGARASAFPAPHGSEICPDRAAYSAPAIDTHKAQCRWPWPFPPANTQWHWIPLP